MCYVKLCCVTLGVVALLTVMAGGAGATVIFSDSFESPPVAVPFGWSYAVPPGGWTKYGTDPVGMFTNLTGSSYASVPNSPTDGSHQSVWANQTPGGSTAVSGDYLVLSGTGLQANMTYTLKADLLWSDGTISAAATLVLGSGSILGTHPLSMDVAQSSTALPVATNQWVTWTEIFVTGASPTGLGDPLRIELGSPNQSAYAQVAFGNVRLDATPTPEPSTLVLLGMASLGLLAYAWRKRK
jgi:hypothetical protein